MCWDSPKLGVVSHQLPDNVAQVKSKNWFVSAHPFQHSEVGGVSDITGRFFLFTRECLAPTTEWRKGPVRTVKSILSSKIPGRSCVPPPVLSSPNTFPTVQFVRPDTVHHDGLFPIKGLFSTKTFAPFIYSKTKFCCRPLSMEERYLVYDHDPTWFTPFDRAKTERVLLMLQHPCKVLVAFGNLLFHTGGVFPGLLHRRSKSKTDGPHKSEHDGHDGPEKLVRSDTDSNTMDGINFDLEDTDLVQRVNEMKMIFHPTLRPMSLKALRTLAVKYPLRSACTPGLMTSQDQRKASAAKADSAGVPVHLWDSQVIKVLQECDGQTFSLPGWCSLGLLRGLDILRSQLTAYACRLLQRSFFDWFKKEHGCSQPKKVVSWSLVDQRYIWNHGGRFRYGKERRALASKHLRSWNAGQDVLWRFTSATWWAWRAGSHPHFWRWPKEYVCIIRDGHPLWMSSRLKPYKVPQRDQRDKEMKAAIVKKIDKVRRLGYIEKGKVDSLTSFFAVPKTENDIRMVYDASVSGLNDVVWAPWFSLPTVRTHLRAVAPHTFMGDVDFGDFFLNFMLADRYRRMAGVDLTLYFPDDSKGGRTLWERWARALMGFRPSPYLAIQGGRHAQSFAMGDRHDPRNVFRWATVRLNLPGQTNYDPSWPWVSKLRKNGQLAADTFQYVDDVRPTGNTETECWEACHTYGSKVNHLGLQDAPRKRRPPSRSPGPWAGSMVATDGTSVSVLITQEKWDKTKKLLRNILACLDPTGPQLLPFKKLERARGYLVYTTRTYPCMVPYLKGIHLTLDSWREGRGPDGWRKNQTPSTDDRPPTAWYQDPDESFDDQSMDRWEWDSAEGLRVYLLEAVGPRSTPPAYVKAVPRLRDDVRALLHLTKSPAPQRRTIRSKTCLVARYGFGDASGVGFGAAVVNATDTTYRIGEWNFKIQEKSSNYREFRNLLEAVRDECGKRSMKGVELFLFTDNTTVEGCFYNGTSSSRVLFNLVLDLRWLEMEHSLHLHVIHIAGTRMIACGVDGLSRGDLDKGLLRGSSPLEFVDLHRSGIDRSPPLLPWINTWMPEGTKLLSPEGWFSNGHGKGPWIWSPPPAAADFALDQLCIARHRDPSVFHLVVVPRLFTSRWRKQLTKIADYLFTFPLTFPLWGKSFHEPLLVGFVYPLYSRYPWEFRKTTFLGELDGALRGLLSDDLGRWGDILRKFCNPPPPLGSVS